MNTDRFRSRAVHLMGIGGAGMSALVPLLRRAGATVDGCDLSLSGRVGHLRDAGIEVAIGHDPEHARDHDILVHTSAVPAQHAELRAARQQGIEVLSRPACLAELMNGMRTLAVAGSHGKTSTTWMIGHLLADTAADPVVMVGGSVADLDDGGSRIGDGRIFVAEVDESDGGFRHVRPDLAVVTNLEAEHLRHYGSFSGLCDAFNRWLQEMGPQDVCLLPPDLEPRVTAGIRARVVTCGLDAGEVHAADIATGEEGSDFDLVENGAVLARLHVPIPGLHMVDNAVKAVTAARLIEPGTDPVRLASCARVGRRFTVHGRPGGIRVVEDYAHHPTEVRATIASAVLGGGRVHVIFQPHRYTRTSDSFHDFIDAFDAATAVVVCPVYAAGEEPIAGAGGRDLAEAVAAHRRAGGESGGLTQYVRRPAEGIGFVSAHARPGDTCLVLGAGDIGACTPELVRSLECSVRGETRL